MIQEPIPLNIRTSDYNNNNLHTRTPYVIDDENTLTIDTGWWNGLTQYIKNLLNKRLGASFKLGNVTIPHEFQSDDRLLTVYQTFQDGYDYNVWYEEKKGICPIGIKMVKLSGTEKVSLMKKDLSCLNELIAQFNEIFKERKPYFVRTSSTSGKNRIPIKPFDNTDDVLKYLISVDEFVLREFNRKEKDTYIIFIPWNSCINARNEFRLFVVNRKLTCASPQKWWVCHDYQSEEMAAIIEAIVGTNIYEKSPYDTFVADVYVDFEKKTCNLIEFNCFGDHSGAGASLFNWENDHDLLYGVAQKTDDNLSEVSGIPVLLPVGFAKAVLRYISRISYPI
jgi:hypothetical protein